MAECLILAFEPGTTDTNAWRLGHVVSIEPDGHTWGSQEGLPKFWILTVIGATVAECAAYSAALVTVEADGYERPIRHRDRILDYASLPQAIKNTLATTGRYSVTKTQADNYIKKVT